MSGFVSPLWILGIGNANPSVSADAGLALAGVAGPVLALPALVGDSLVPAALSALVGDNGPVAAHSVVTGAIYG